MIVIRENRLIPNFRRKRCDLRLSGRVAGFNLNRQAKGERAGLRGRRAFNKIECYKRFRREHHVIV